VSGLSKILVEAGPGSKRVVLEPGRQESPRARNPRSRAGKSRKSSLSNREARRRGKLGQCRNAINLRSSPTKEVLRQAPCHLRLPTPLGPKERQGRRPAGKMFALGAPLVSRKQPGQPRRSPPSAPNQSRREDPLLDDPGTAPQTSLRRMSAAFFVSVAINIEQRLPRDGFPAAARKSDRATTRVSQLNTMFGQAQGTAVTGRTGEGENRSPRQISNPVVRLEARLGPMRISRVSSRVGIPDLHQPEAPGDASSSWRISLYSRGRRGAISGTSRAQGRLEECSPRRKGTRHSGSPAPKPGVPPRRKRNQVLPLLNLGIPSRFRSSKQSRGEPVPDPVNCESAPNTGPGTAPATRWRLPKKIRVASPSPSNDERSTRTPRSRDQSTEWNRSLWPRGYSKIRSISGSPSE